MSWPSHGAMMCPWSTLQLKLPFFKQCMYVGEDGAGKTSLIRRIQGIEEYKKGRGLEYLYLNVHDEDRDGECGLLSQLGGTLLLSTTVGFCLVCHCSAGVLECHLGQ